MGKIVISTNVSLDGVVQDPTVRRASGWAAGSAESGGKDLEEWAKVEFDEALRTEALLLGRRSDEWFAARWASRPRRVGGPAEQPAQVRRVLDPRRPRVDQRDGPERRRGRRGHEAEAGAGRRHRRLRQLSARAHAARARPRRRAAAVRLPGRARRRRAPLRRDQRQEAACAWSTPGPSATASSSSPTRSSGRPSGRRMAQRSEQARMPARCRAGIRALLRSES